MNSAPKTYNRVIHVHCDEEMYENFQTLRRQLDEASDASLGRKLFERGIREELDGASTQRYFQATYKEHLQRIEWLLLALFSAQGTELAAITKLAGKPQAAREIIQTIAVSYAQTHHQFKTEIQRIIDTTPDN